MTKQSVVSTLNQKGFTYSLSSFGNAFVDYASRAEKPVVDIGAAYGVATLPALLGGGKVIAVDISPDHLTAIGNSIDDSLKERLTTINSRFPDFTLPDESVSAVYLSQILPFLKGDEIEAGVKKLYEWLEPGGCAFVVSFTPFISHVRSFIPEYLEKKSKGVRWPGFIEDLSEHCNDPHIFRNLPNQITHLDADDLRWVFEKAGFEIKDLRYFGEEEGELPVGIRMDGRERVGLIASKPERRPLDPARLSWKKIGAMQAGEVPAAIWEWLAKPFVLSKALARVCTDFKVTISEQRLHNLHADEVGPLGCYDYAYGFVRETYLGEPGDPLVYARVSIPYTSYLKNKSALDNLGTRPIGEALLYGNPEVTRSEFEIKRVSLNDELMFDAIVHQSFFQAVIERNGNVPEVWARRSTFSVAGEPLLVTEVFLANIPQYVN
jgi:chorismate-pyruvate lyase/ubiquinone/menaquinone biosynthesis C-methylase UbiE